MFIAKKSCEISPMMTSDLRIASFGVLERKVAAFLRRKGSFNSNELESKVKFYAGFAFNQFIPILKRRLKRRRAEVRLLFFCAEDCIFAGDPINDYARKLREHIEGSHFTIDMLDLCLPFLYCLVAAYMCDILSQKSKWLDDERCTLNHLSRLLDKIISVEEGQFEEDICPIESYLLGDPAGAYRAMAPESKRAYRSRVVTIAGAGISAQIGLVTSILEKAHVASGKDRDSRDSHVGYYLLESESGGYYRSSNHSKQDEGRDHIFIGAHISLAIAIGLVFISAGVLICLDIYRDIYLLPSLVVILYQSLVPTVEYIHARIHGPRLLPRVDFIKSGLPSHANVVIAIPTILSDMDQVRRIIAVAERNAVAANDSEVTVAILSDFCDANRCEPTTEENAILDFCKSEITRLNRKYIRSDREPFALLHRDRHYSKSEQCWMGWERKRGKLEEFNAFLLDERDAFVDKIGADKLPGVKYVLVLDDDCYLARDAIQTMVGVLEHPLGKPRTNAEGSVIGGYGLVVPNTSTLVASVAGWRWSFLVTGPQSEAWAAQRHTRNFLFDVNGRCHYPGKGLYHVAVFQRACIDRVPESLILSHDTLEAAWVRPAYLGEAAVVEGFPSSMRGLIARNHRWMRGNLQNLWFALSHSHRERFPQAFWYVLFHQLLADVTPAIIACTLITVIFLYPKSILLVSLITLVFSTASSCIRMVGLFASFFRNLQFAILALALSRWFLFVLFRLSSSAQLGLVFLDALVRTAWRLLVGKRLLDWTPAALAEKSLRSSVVYLWGSLASLIAFAVLLFLTYKNELSLGALFILGIWSLQPVLLKFMEGGGKRI